MTQPPHNELESGLVWEVGQLRRDPAAYAQILETERKPFYKGTELVLRGKTRRDDIHIETHEGVSACNEAIEFLKRAEPLPPLTLDTGLSLAAKNCE